MWKQAEMFAAPGFLKGSRPKKSGMTWRWSTRLCKVLPALPTAISKTPMSTSCSKTALQKCYRCKVAGHDIKGKVENYERPNTSKIKKPVGMYLLYFKWKLFPVHPPFKKLSKCLNCQSSGNSGTEVGTLLLFEWSRGLWMRCHEG